MDIVIEGLTKVFVNRADPSRSVTAVNNVSLSIAPGQLVTLLGPSGCGKTTILRIIAGFETPTSGKVLLGGRDITHTPPNKRDTALVFQNYALFPHLTVWENVTFGLKLRKDISPEEQKARAERVLSQVGLSDMAQRSPDQLSGGQQQRVALARAIVNEPRVLLFDEPLSNLDAKLREQMRLEIRALQQRHGITSVYVTHDQSEAMAISDRIVILKDGRIEQAGTPEEVYTRPATHFVADFIGRANFVSARVAGVSKGGYDLEVNGRTVFVPGSGQDSFGPGDFVDILLRPENTYVLPRSGAVGQPVPGAGAQGELTPVVDGRLVRRSFLGAVVEYEIEVPGHPRLLAEMSNPFAWGLLEPGSEVTVYFSPRVAHLLRRP
ncbi:MAG: hypothetical protein BAA04_00210 [Firmicutes bacterium ZCTH02-B6]|nr:MAG: hypothetical protein BAA04_00210 [Firmicutes bacterium ZCTH02-B6]